MDPIFEKNLITTKDAGELFGYTSDYLARLARSGKIAGKRIGHSWFIEKESLARFLDQQGIHKVDYARTLAREREIEYRKHRSLLHTVEKRLSKPFTRPRFNIKGNALYSQTIALSISFLVVAFGAYVAYAAPFAQFVTKADVIAREAAFGFNATFENIPSRIASKINSVSEDVSAYSARVIARKEIASEKIVPVILINTDLSRLQMAIADDHRASRIAFVPNAASVQVAPITPITIENVQSSALVAYTIITHPLSVAHTFVNEYRAIGTHAYTAINASLAEYQIFIKYSGTKTLALAATTRDIFATAPRFVNQMNLAFGNSIINVTHSAIRADVTLAYGTAAAAPATARATVALVGSVGDVLANTTAHVAIHAPSTLARALAQAIFDAEYAGASHFVAFTDSATQNSLALAHVATSFFANAPIAFEDAYLGTLGKSALVLRSFSEEGLATISHVPGAAAVLAAAAPTLSAGEQLALAIYETINGFFDSTGRALAFLFSPQPSVVMPVINKIAVTATSTPSTIKYSTISYSYPSYTTIVKGISEDFLNQSLASLKFQSITSAENVTQSTSRSILSLFTKGMVITNGTSIAATTGNFTNLTGGTTNLGATTVTSDLAVSGAISSDTSATAPYFTATSATATSTFAGPLAIGTSTPYGSGLVTIGTSTPLLYISSNTGRIGIGTSSPDAMVSILQSANGAPIMSVYRATDSNPSGDFINYRMSDGTALFRVDNSGNLLAGGIVNSGSQTITSTSQPQFRVQYNVNNEFMLSTGLTGTTTIFMNGSSPGLVFTPQVNRTNSFNFTNAAASNSILSIDTLNRRIGIGTTTPASILDIFGTDAIHLPVGTTGERPTMALAGQVRYNTTTHQFEGYGDNAVWQGLGGVINPAQTTYITAGADDYLRFVTASAERMTITNTGLIGVGTTSPFANLSVAGVAGGNTNLFAISTSTASATTTALTVNQNGNLALLNGTYLTIGSANATTIAGNGATSTIYGPLTVRGIPNTASPSMIGTATRSSKSTPMPTPATTASSATRPLSHSVQT
ncbi:MAG: helix-turn-helix domain-containing protein [Candidatus Kaiserbacteria bacterium]|nr:helix-turn-helix domain-containing protein [Candidatus Kaiserbacteria bacterium]